MLPDIVLLGAVTLLGVLEQAYFSLQVIAARRKYSVSPPSTSGSPEFERVFRAQSILERMPQVCSAVISAKELTALNIFLYSLLFYGCRGSSSIKAPLQHVDFYTCLLDINILRGTVLLHRPDWLQCILTLAFSGL
ncbi:uncharacterized protein LOC120932527 isoform X2 [Rana temporaria]|uniref:uncharacterized protein LOC120932527 isoform X2 n=1 Tax=Rana temporaria TaxID=8407 RepID=UPI001AAD20D8|nr:uncharacterized protein LOC120932527 isoform X2 [Rana temporaria]